MRSSSQDFVNLNAVVDVAKLPIPSVSKSWQEAQSEEPVLFSLADVLLCVLPRLAQDKPYKQ